MTKPKPPPALPLPGKGQFSTTSDDERRIQRYLDSQKRRGLDLSRAQALALLVRRGLDAEGVAA